jgi:hypothetical protein
MAQRQPCHRRHSSLLRMINPEDWRRSREGNTRGQERICCSRRTLTRRRWSHKPWAARSWAFAPALLLRRLAGPQSLVHRNDSGPGKMKLLVQGVTWATPRATALLALGPAPPLLQSEEKKPWNSSQWNIGGLQLYSYVLCGANKYHSAWATSLIKGTSLLPIYWRLPQSKCSHSHRQETCTLDGSKTRKTW